MTNKQKNEEIHYGQGIIDVYIDASHSKSERFDATGAGIYLRHEDGRNWMYFVGADYHIPQSEVWACTLALSLIPVSIPVNICTDYVPLFDFFVAGNHRQKFYHMREGGNYFSELTRKLQKRKYVKTMVNSMTNRHHLIAHNLANMARVLVKNECYIENNIFYAPKENRSFCLWSKETPFYALCQKNYLCFPEDTVKDSFYSFEGFCLEDCQKDYPDKELKLTLYDEEGNEIMKEREIEMSKQNEENEKIIKKFNISKKKGEILKKKNKKERRKERQLSFAEGKHVLPSTIDIKNEIKEEGMGKEKEGVTGLEKEKIEEERISEDKKEKINDYDFDDSRDEPDVISIDFACPVQKETFKGRKYLPLSLSKNTSSVFDNWRKKNPSKLIAPCLEIPDFNFSSLPVFMYRVSITETDFLSDNPNFVVDPNLIKDAVFRTVGVYQLPCNKNIWKEKTLTKDLITFLRALTVIIGNAVLGKRHAHASAILLDMPEKENISDFVLERLYIFQDLFRISFLTRNGNPLTDYYFSECTESVHPELWKKAGTI